MYQTSQAVTDYIMGDARHFTAIMSFSSGTILSEEICTLDRFIQTGTDDLCPGDVLSASLTGTLIGLSDTIVGETFLLNFIGTSYDNNSTYGYLHNYTYGALHSYYYAGMPGSLPYEPIPMGEFKVSSCEKQGELWYFEAHDQLYASDKAYNSALTYPASLADVEHELCRGLGIKYRDSIESITISAKPEGYTYRQMLGFIAGIFGKVCLIGRTGKLEYKGFTATEYDLDPNRSAEPEVSQTGIRISTVKCGSFSATASGPAGRTISFTDPLMTAANFETVKTAFLGRSYTPLRVEHLMGDPRLDPLDIVTVHRLEDNRDFDIPIMVIDLHWDGGIMAQLSATASSEAQYAAQSNVRSLSDQVKQISYSESEMQAAIDGIKGANGGYVIFEFNAQGQPTAHYYADELDLGSATNILKMGRLGMQASSNGINGYFDSVIDSAGRINASRILTGFLKAIQIMSENYDDSTSAGMKIDLSDGSFTLADGKITYSNGELLIEAETSAETDTVIHVISGDYEAEFSPLGVKVTDSDSGAEAVMQAGEINISSGAVTTVQISANGDISAAGDVTIGGTLTVEGNISANDIGIKLSDSDTTYESLRDYMINHP